MAKLVIATRNVHKIREIREIIGPLVTFDLLTLLDFPSYVPPEETGVTFCENATIKAVDAAKKLGLWALADDSGLVVPSIQGEPGVYSARFAGPQATDKENRKKLLLVMAKIPESERMAYFECCMALASPSGLQKCCSATCEGKILFQEQGGSGFGYDSLFVKNDYRKSFAEMESSVKNKISHRRKALDKILLFLLSISES
ncbi:MAG: RdgB/HAM1 family non-canonical purine NTP pyrophosphatase [Chlamydiota bacterium]